VNFLLSREDFARVNFFVRDTDFLKKGISPENLPIFGILPMDRYVVITFMVDYES
jgi:hypothetical protein